MSKVARICEASKQRGNALVLLLLLKTWDGPEAPDAYSLAKLAHISSRQAERDLQKLIDAGEAERVPDAVKGRGHVTRYRLAESPSDVSDKTTTEVTDFIAPEISASHPSDIGESTTHLTDLSDSKGVTSDGTPIAPLRPKTTQEKKGAKAPRDKRGGWDGVGRSDGIGKTDDALANSEGLTLHTYIGRLIQFREEDSGAKLPAHKGEARAAKWLFTTGYTLGEVQDCYRFLKGQGWRGEAVTLMKVAGQIAAWKKGELSDGVNGKRSQAGAAGNTSQVGGGGASRQARIYAALSEQTPERVLGTARASALDRDDADAGATRQAGGNYDGGRAAVHFR